MTKRLLKCAIFLAFMPIFILLILFGCIAGAIITAVMYIVYGEENYSYWEKCMGLGENFYYSLIRILRL